MALDYSYGMHKQAIELIYMYMCNDCLFVCFL